MLRRKLALAIALVLLLIQPAPAAVRWHQDIATAQQLAAQQQRLVLLHFYSEWCAPCQRLKRELYPRPEVAQAISANYVPVKIDGVRFRQLAAEYQVDRFPTEMIIDPAGQVLLRTVTPPDPERYIQLLNQVAASQRETRPGEPLAGSPSNPAGANPASLAPNTHDAVNFRQQNPPPGEHSQQFSPHPNYAAPQNEDPNPTWPSNQPASPWNHTEEWQGRSQTPQAAWGPNPMGPADPAHRQPSAAAAGFGAETYNPFVASTPRPSSGSPCENPASDPPLALDGYCPVALADRDTWEAGDARWGAFHRGRTYLFHSESHQRRFLADPDRFSPVLSGVDPLRYFEDGVVALGQRGHGMWFRGKMYLFADEASLERFQRRPDYYAQKSHELMVHGQFR